MAIWSGMVSSFCPTPCVLNRMQSSAQITVNVHIVAVTRDVDQRLSFPITMPRSTLRFGAGPMNAVASRSIPTTTTAQK